MTHLAPDATRGRIVGNVMSGLMLGIMLARPNAGVCSRLNGLYMAAYFAGGAVGPTLGGWSYVRGGWPLAMWAGPGLPVLALTCFLTEQPENPFDGDCP